MRFDPSFVGLMSVRVLLSVSLLFVCCLCRRKVVCKVREVVGNGFSGVCSKLVNPAFLYDPLVIISSTKYVDEIGPITKSTAITIAYLD